MSATTPQYESSGLSAPTLCPAQTLRLLRSHCASAVHSPIVPMLPRTSGSPRALPRPAVAPYVRAMRGGRHGRLNRSSTFEPPAAPS